MMSKRFASNSPRSLWCRGLRGSASPVSLSPPVAAMPITPSVMMTPTATTASTPQVPTAKSPCFAASPEAKVLLSPVPVSGALGAGSEFGTRAPGDGAVGGAFMLPGAGREGSSDDGAPDVKGAPPCAASGPLAAGTPDGTNSLGGAALLPPIGLQASG